MLFTIPEEKNGIKGIPEVPSTMRYGELSSLPDLIIARPAGK